MGGPSLAVSAGERAPRSPRRSADHAARRIVRSNVGRPPLHALSPGCARRDRLAPRAGWRAAGGRGTPARRGVTSRARSGQRPVRSGARRCDRAALLASSAPLLRIAEPGRAPPTPARASRSGRDRHRRCHGARRIAVPALQRCKRGARHAHLAIARARGRGAPDRRGRRMAGARARAGPHLPCGTAAVNAPAGPHAGYAPGHGGPAGAGDAPAPAHATPGSGSERSRNDKKQTDGEGRGARGANEALTPRQERAERAAVLDPARAAARRCTADAQRSAPDGDAVHAGHRVSASWRCERSSPRAARRLQTLAQKLAPGETLDAGLRVDAGGRPSASRGVERSEPCPCCCGSCLASSSASSPSC